MPEMKPTQDEILTLLGRESFDVWKAVCHFVLDHYNMDANVWKEPDGMGTHTQS
ncbi:MAG TPA: hypothetical protein GX521_10190 [Firmicutes bacterium]|jgi:hypothetical protein|nr:hypothetical protein [Bacillota bacterium]